MLGATAARAQPVDPYGEGAGSAGSASEPPPSPLPPPLPLSTPPPTSQPSQAAKDPALAEQVAASLVARAQELLEAERYIDAKQLAVEALVQAPTGKAASAAQRVIKQANIALGINVPPSAPPPEPPPSDNALKPAEPIAPPRAEGAVGYPRPAAAVHGFLYGGMLGTAIGSFFTSKHEAAGAVPTGLGVGIVGALVAPLIATHVHADEAQVREIGAGTVWGGALGGLLVGTIEGADGGQATGRAVLVGTAVGATIGGLGGISFAIHHRLTRGDVALTDTLAGIGAIGGLSLGLLMQPAQREAYSLNSTIGVAAGVITGIIVGPMTNTTPRRMLRVAGLAALGGGVPYLVYAANQSGAAQRVAGGLSCLGLVGGAWLGFYLTRHLDEGLDVNDDPDKDDAPPAVVGRSSSGRWDLGGLGLLPLSPQLTTDRGAALTLVGGAF